MTGKAGKEGPEGRKGEKGWKLDRKRFFFLFSCLPAFLVFPVFPVQCSCPVFLPRLRAVLVLLMFLNDFVVKKL